MLQRQYHTLRQEIFDQADQKLTDLNLKALFSKVDMDAEKDKTRKLKKRISELKAERWYVLFAGISFGAIIAIVIIHYT